MPIASLKQFGCLLAFSLGIASLPARGQAPATDPDAGCLACHGQRDFKSDSGRSLFVDQAKHETGVHAGLACSSCHVDIKEFPHPAHVAKVECSACHGEEAADLPKSVHAILGEQSCSTCHGSAHDARPAISLMPRQCAACDSEEVNAFLASAHGRAQKNHDPQSPTCANCHGPIHKILAADDPLSRVAKKNQPGTCGSCHSDPGFLAKHQIPFSHPVETYQASVHGRALAAGNQNAASCSDCHSSHGILGGRDPKARTNRWNVPHTCGTCHQAIEKTYLESIHGQAVAHGSLDAPVCTDCHGDHTILAPDQPQSLVNPARVSSVTCGRCHGDARLDARYNLPGDRVPTFADSFHGLAARAGSQTVANCASCHGIHNIFPSSDPRSTVNAANLAHTCGNCHPGAGSAFAIGAVHVAAASLSEHPVVKWIRLLYWILIPLTVSFMFFHQLLDFLRKLFQPRRSTTGEKVERMNLHFRIAHWLTAASFPVLVFTGFALKFPDTWWAHFLLVGESRYAFRGTVHRAAAIVLMASLAYHFVHLTLVRRDRAMLRNMVPGTGDLRDLGGMFLYNLGFSKTRPVFGVFSYVEKIEYLAFLWGSAVMAGSGFILWFNNFALRHFPKWVSDAATALHFYEAILATLSILIWHLYTVVFDPDVYPMDPAWLTGKTSGDHLRHTRPAYYAERIEAERMLQQDSPRSPASPDESDHPEAE